MTNKIKTKIISILPSLSKAISEGLFPILPSNVLSSIITNAAYDVIKDTFRISKQDRDDLRIRAKQAGDHLIEAGKILSELQIEITNKYQEFEKIINDIDIHQKEAEHWKEIASVNEKLASTLTKEIEKRVQKQIRFELDRNKKRRKIMAIIVWLITLIAGGIFGVIIQDLWNKGLFNNIF